MEKIYSNQKANKGSGGLGRYIEIPCSECDILYLERICMIPGMHYITVPSLVSGRQMIVQIIQALSWHQNIGYITLDDQQILQEIGTNILQSCQWPLDQETLETFLIHSFYDFLLIESSPELNATTWIDTFIQQLVAYNIHTMIPILIMQRMQ
jgi:hypothetical protein